MLHVELNLVAFLYHYKLKIPLIIFCIFSLQVKIFHLAFFMSFDLQCNGKGSFHSDLMYEDVRIF